MIRPERARILEYGCTGENHMPAMIDRLVYLGPTTQVVVRLPHGDTVQVLVANTDDQIVHEPGTPVTLVLPPEALRALPDDRRFDVGDDDVDLAGDEADERAQAADERARAANEVDARE